VQVGCPLCAKSGHKGPRCLPVDADSHGPCGRWNDRFAEVLPRVAYIIRDTKAAEGQHESTSANELTGVHSTSATSNVGVAPSSRRCGTWCRYPSRHPREERVLLASDSIQFDQTPRSSLEVTEEDMK
jgi:hypothetical protein